MRGHATGVDWLKLLISDAVQAPLPFGRWGTLVKQLGLRGHVTGGIPDTLDVLVEAEAKETKAAAEATATMERDKAEAAAGAEAEDSATLGAGTERGPAEDSAMERRAAEDLAAEAWTLQARSAEAMDAAAAAVVRLKVSIPRFHRTTEQNWKQFAL